MIIYVVDDDAFGRTGHGRGRRLQEPGGIIAVDARTGRQAAVAGGGTFVNPEAIGGSCTSPAAVSGYPLLTVPSGLAAGLPVAVSFWGTAGSEATLVEIAHGYEAARDRDSGPLPGPTFQTFI